jgi:hypothetical protein
MKFFPVDPINIPFTGTSTDFVAVNNSSGPKEYIFAGLQICHIRRGYADVSAATTADFRLASGLYVFLSLMPGEGVRVIRSSVDGVLQIGDTSL